MHAIFVCESERYDGSARAFVAAAHGLVARGWQAAVACPADGHVARRVAEAGLEVVPLGAKPSLFGGAERLRRALQSRRVDVVYVHTEHEQLAAATAVWRAKRGLVVRRIPPGERLTHGRSARAALRIAPTAVLATWPEQAELPGDVGRLPTVVGDVGVDGIETPPPPDDDSPEANGWRGERRLVCVCDASARARTAVVLRAVAMLAPRHRELRLVLVGPGATDEQLRLHAAALGIHRLVRHALTPADDAAARATAHVGWVTADGDDGAFGALDFMAAGVPVFADRGSVPARYVADAITGVHVSPAEVPDTAASLAALLARDEERTAMGNAGRARLLRTFGEAAMIDGFARAATAAEQRGAVARR